MSSTTSQPHAREHGKSRQSAYRIGFKSDNPLLIALLYLILLALAETITVLAAAQFGVLLHLGILFLLMVHTAIVWERPLRRMLMTLTFVPLIRVISMSLPLADFPLLYWYLITSVPLFFAVFVVMRFLAMDRHDLGLHWHMWPVQLIVAASGFALGYVEYLILRPEPLIDEFTIAELWLPALILLVSTGYLEELIFRRLMQRTAVEHLGRWLGIIYVALFFAILHIGYKSLADVLFVLIVGLVFGLVVYFTNSLIGVTLAHGLTNISLFLVVPFLLSGTEAPGQPLVQKASPVSVTAGAVSIDPASLLANSSPAAGQSGELPTAVVVTVMGALTRLDGTTPLPTAPSTADAVLSYTPTTTLKAVPAGTVLVQHVLQPGQILDALARHYRTTIVMIRSQNNLTDGEEPQVGALVSIPVEWPAPLAPTDRSHIVEAGDTVSGIAQQYGTTVVELVKLNWLPDPGLIIPGQVLWLPD